MSNKTDNKSKNLIEVDKEKVILAVVMLGIAIEMIDELSTIGTKEELASFLEDEAISKREKFSEEAIEKTIKLVS